MVVLVYASCIGGRWPACLPTYLPTYAPIYPFTYCICPSPRRHCTAKYPLPCAYMPTPSQPRHPHYHHHRPVPAPASSSSSPSSSNSNHHTYSFSYLPALPRLRPRPSPTNTPSPCSRSSNPSCTVSVKFAKHGDQESATRIRTRALFMAGQQVSCCAVGIRVCSGVRAGT